ncbi:MAG: hypothetical protein ACK559_14870, partial [bacterium]
LRQEVQVGRGLAVHACGGGLAAVQAAIGRRVVAVAADGAVLTTRIGQADQDEVFQPGAVALHAPGDGAHHREGVRGITDHHQRVAAARAGVVGRQADVGLVAARPARA